jgi:Spy/CpxP family protein refolding chaperone
MRKIAVSRAGIVRDCSFVLAGLFLLAAFPASIRAQSNASPSPAAHKSAAVTATTSAENAATIARLTESNQELLDLLKKQQAVLEDIQYDRRLQNRQISSLEARLEDTLQQNADLQAKIAKLEEQISIGPSAVPTSASPAEVSPKVGAVSPASAPVSPTAAAVPPPPASYLPIPDTQGMPGTKSWHRLFTLSGTDGKNSDVFQIQGPQWRVLWHNQDRPGNAYANTSALFISAFPKDDTIPQKVCSKLGSGGDATELNGPGSFYLKVEASGGSWELAVEDFK